MRHFILFLPAKLQPIVIICLTILFAFACAIFCGAFFDVHQLVTNTDLISSVYEVMGTVYAILLTFTLWGVWQHFIEAGTSVQNEAYALLDLVHMIEYSSDDNHKQIGQTALTYLNVVINDEWPALKSTRKDCINYREHSHTEALAIIRAVQHIVPTDKRESVIFNQTLGLLTRWMDARRTRILIARGNSARALWPLIMIGALVLFGFHGLFVANTIAIWSTLLFGFSLVIGVTFYLIFSLDCPFSGSLSIDFTPFIVAADLLKSSLKEMNLINNE